MFDVLIDNKSLKLQGFLTEKRPPIPTAKRKTITSTALSSDGAVYRDTDFFEDVEIEISFNFLANEDNWHDHLRLFRSMILNGKTLMFSDDMHFFRRIKSVEIGDCDRPVRQIGRVKVKFVVDAYEYSVSGARFIKDPKDYAFNRYAKCRPIYKIIGGGMAELTVNGYRCQVSTPGTIYIDTEKHLAYGEDGQNLNANTNADFDRLFLMNGMNEISITGGRLEVKPNWRSI